MISAPQFYQHLTKVIQYLPKQDFWTACDAQADVVYINFHQPALPADDVIIRYQDDEITGLSILNISLCLVYSFLNNVSKLR